jgi:hypothetical protein
MCVWRLRLVASCDRFFLSTCPEFAAKNVRCYGDLLQKDSWSWRTPVINHAPWATHEVLIKRGKAFHTLIWKKCEEIIYPVLNLQRIRLLLWFGAHGTLVIQKQTLETNTLTILNWIRLSLLTRRVDGLLARNILYSTFNTTALPCGVGSGEFFSTISLIATI